MLGQQEGAADFGDGGFGGGGFGAARAPPPARPPPPPAAPAQQGDSYLESAVQTADDWLRWALS